ncbi:GNAT family N-acetyltransferase, partial [Bacillus sp. HC-TM]
ATSVELNVLEFNKKAIRFYEKLGFKTQSRQMELVLLDA